MRVITVMILVEPTDVYELRSSAPSNAKQSISRDLLTQKESSLTANRYGPLTSEDDWDEQIVAHLIAQQGKPTLIVSIASQLRKFVRHRDREHKEKLKRDILMRVGALIRAGTVMRVRRKFVIARPVCG